MNTSVSSNLSSIDRARLLAGLSDLSQAFIKGEQGRYGMRIPAEPYRDGDLVCGGALRLIGAQNAEIERLRTALRSYGHHVHPNCYDLRLNEDGTLGERNGCLCGFDAVKSANSGPKTSRPACSICDDTGSMSDGTACPHLSLETGVKP